MCTLFFKVTIIISNIELSVGNDYTLRINVHYTNQEFSQVDCHPQPCNRLPLTMIFAFFLCCCLCQTGHWQASACQKHQTLWLCPAHLWRTYNSIEGQILSRMGVASAVSAFQLCAHSTPFYIHVPKLRSYVYRSTSILSKHYNYYAELAIHVPSWC